MVPPFSLLLTEDEELGLEVDALLENWRVLQSGGGGARASLIIAILIVRMIGEAGWGGDEGSRVPTRRFWI